MHSSQADEHTQIKHAGSLRGLPVSIKLVSCQDWAPDSPSLQAAVRAAALRHPNLHEVYEFRAAILDAQDVERLAPLPMLRPGWPLRPAGRLHRILTGGPPQAQLGVGSLTVYPGDMQPLPPPPELQQQQQQQQPDAPRDTGCWRQLRARMSAVRLVPGGHVVAVIGELCGEGTLADRSRAAGSPFKPGRSRDLPAAQRALLGTAREVASALAALHAAGIAHGGLHPASVLLVASSADGRGFSARLADVGSPSLAHAAAHPAAAGPCLLWLAPEALYDEAGAASPAADVYGFGLLLYVMAAGEMPFEGMGLAPSLIAMASCAIVRPEWPTGHHDHLEPLFRDCTATDPGQRPSAAQVTERLCRLEAAAGGASWRDGLQGAAP
ncbi:hypothetical protein GPECTOR_1g423 [Gonium pectorale]|uniref:Protein kinase domain-containing protein n=1 Tax=Gonium pectorale TaxID=33097 RepID=A0A150H385_GONPE|nr:hypothetical protein GPECTOR_1g423 [Gonium pectorale]|eukprot:KXZ56473.1 hypothetical protein GPECTOR_1g423 [Gonium pectorale]